KILTTRNVTFNEAIFYTETTEPAEAQSGHILEGLFSYLEIGNDHQDEEDLKETFSNYIPMHLPFNPTEKNISITRQGTPIRPSDVNKQQWP
ncbi:hypothetical protein E4U16_004563, partial [Claviceps sp. LM84 group G4]